MVESTSRGCDQTASLPWKKRLSSQTQVSSDRWATHDLTPGPLMDIPMRRRLGAEHASAGQSGLWSQERRHVRHGLGGEVGVKGWQLLAQDAVHLNHLLLALRAIQRIHEAIEQAVVLRARPSGAVLSSPAVLRRADLGARPGPLARVEAAPAVHGAERVSLFGFSALSEWHRHRLDVEAGPLPVLRHDLDLSLVLDPSVRFNLESES